MPRGLVLPFLVVPVATAVLVGAFSGTLMIGAHEQRVHPPGICRRAAWHHRHSNGLRRDGHIEVRNHASRRSSTSTPRRRKPLHTQRPIGSRFKTCRHGCCAWAVVTSVSIMLIGMYLHDLLHGTTSVDRMEHDASSIGRTPLSRCRQRKWKGDHRGGHRFAGARTRFFASPVHGPVSSLKSDGSGFHTIDHISCSHPDAGPGCCILR